MKINESRKSVQTAYSAVFLSTAKFLLNQITEAEFLQDTSAYPPVYYYAGIKRLFANDRDTAIAYFQKCAKSNPIAINVDIEWRLFYDCELLFSKAELEALEK